MIAFNCNNFWYEQKIFWEFLLDAVIIWSMNIKFWGCYHCDSLISRILRCYKCRIIFILFVFSHLTNVSWGVVPKWNKTPCFVGSCPLFICSVRVWILTKWQPYTVWDQDIRFVPIIFTIKICLLKYVRKSCAVHVNGESWRTFNVSLNAVYFK